MSARSLWLRIGASCSVAAVLLLVAAPARPRAVAALPLAVSPAVGAITGLALFAVLARRLPPSLPRIGATTAGVLLVLAGAEEVTWRWFLLGASAAVVGLPLAIASTSVGFGIAHRDAPRVHVVTGTVFGGAYATTGSLACAWLAHGVYNLCAATILERPPEDQG